MSPEAMKSEALNEFARALNTATTIEEAKGLALLMMRQMLDLIHGGSGWTAPSVADLNDQFRDLMAEGAAPVLEGSFDAGLGRFTVDP